MDSAKDMEELLMGLQQMKLSNPDVFKQAMQSLGLPTESENASMLDENDSLLKMAEAIKMMKKPNADEDMIGGNDLIISKDKPKQVSVCCSPGTAPSNSKFLFTLVSRKE